MEPVNKEESREIEELKARYRYPLVETSGGDRTHFQEANAIYMVGRNDLNLVVEQTMAKDRIRWLAVQNEDQQSTIESQQAKIERVSGEALERFYKIEELQADKADLLGILVQVQPLLMGLNYQIVSSVIAKYSASEPKDPVAATEAIRKLIGDSTSGGNDEG